MTQGHVVSPERWPWWGQVLFGIVVLAIIPLGVAFARWYRRRK